jgi:putative endonuclease
MKPGYIYILTNPKNTVLYIGVTSNLPQRIWQHKSKLINGFSKRYNLIKLIYFEEYTSIEDAIIIEKRMKKWKRKWKENLINQQNSDWKDLYNEII